MLKNLRKQFDLLGHCRELNVEISDDEMKARLKKWSAPSPRYKSGVMAKYAKAVSSAVRGAVTNQ